MNAHSPELWEQLKRIFAGLSDDQRKWLLGQQDPGDVLWVLDQLDPEKAVALFQEQNPDIDLNALPPDRANEADYSPEERQRCAEIAARLIEMVET